MLHTVSSCAQMLHRGVSFRYIFTVCACILVLNCLSLSLALADETSTPSPHIPATHRQHFDVAPGPLAAVLEQFIQQSGARLVFTEAQVQGLNSAGATGNHTHTEALAFILAGTGLLAHRDASGSLVLHPVSTSAPENHTTRLAEVTVTGTSLPVDVQKYPGSVSVLNPEDLAHTSTLIGALSRVPGVSTGGDSGRGMGQQFNIRGFGYQSEDRVIILQDGVRRSASLYSNHISSFRSDNNLIKTVEIIKGASSVIHGGGAIGGVVSITTKDATDFITAGHEHGFASGVRYESNNYREAWLAAAKAPEDSNLELLAYGKVGKRGNLTMARDWENADGTSANRVGNDEEPRTAFLKGGLHINPDSRIDLSLYSFSQDSRVTWQSLYHPSISTVTGPVVGKMKQHDIVANYILAPAHSQWVDLQATIYKSGASYDRGYSYINSSTSLPDVLDYENRDSRWGLRLRNTAAFSALTANHRLVLGMDYENREEDATYLLNGEYSDFGSMPNRYRDFGAYIHLESAFLDDTLVFQLSGRYDRFNRKVNANEGSYKNNNFSPRAGLSAEILEGLNLLANYSESFRAPTPHETSSSGPLNPHYWYLPNPALKPETIKEYELGFSYTKSGLFQSRDLFKTKLMYFNGRIRDMIALKALEGDLSPQGSPYATYMNVHRVKRHGAEFQAIYDAPRAGGNLGYSTLTQVNRSTGENTPNGFADKLNLGLYVRPLPELTTSINITHWFKPNQNPENIISGGLTYWYARDDYTVTDIRAVWTPHLPHALWFRDVEIAFGINNLFDSIHINARDVETTTRVGTGRNVYMSLAARF